MRVFDKFKLWYNCKTTGRMEDYEMYKKQLEQNKSNINLYTKSLNEAQEKFDKIKLSCFKDSREYINAKNEVNRWKYNLDESKLVSKFIRPNSNQDIDYRNNQYENFSNNLRSVLSDNLDLRFHGTPIYFAEQIIKTGKIASTADRYDGYIKSTDMVGEISVSDKENLETTIHLFSDIAAYNRSLPCGCIFALLPSKKDNEMYGLNLMHSVDLKENPKQLFGIFTTPENINQVKKWMDEGELNSDLVHTFEEFLEVVKLESNKIKNQLVVDSETLKDNKDSIDNIIMKNRDEKQQQDYSEIEK